MRLSLIIPSFYPAVVYGGPIFATLNAAKALGNRGIDIYVSTTDANGQERLDIDKKSFLPLCKNVWVKYYPETVTNRFSLSMLVSLWKDIKDADIVHVQSIFSTPTPIGLAYAKLFGKPILLSPRGSLCEWCLKERSSFKQRWLTLLIRPFARSIHWHATSEIEKRDILNLFPNATIHLIPDGVDVDEFAKPKYLSKSQFMHRFANIEKKPKKIIVSMGRIHKVKGFDILLESFARLRKKFPDTVLFIAGKDDGFLDFLKNKSEQLGLGNSLFFTGALQGRDKVDFLANADLFVLPSHTENFGIVYAESLAAGTPIIASRNTPWSMVEDFECGAWVPNNVDDTASSMEILLKKNRDELRNNARKLASVYDWKYIALKFENLFNELSEK
jgi:glycosyltransferase involved in cell wall biosynthesis